MVSAAASEPRRLRPLTLAAILLAPWALAACATLSPEQCRVVDWREQGFRDGRNGAADSRLNGHAESCAKAGIVPDGAAWLAGRAEGLRLYCTPEQGYREGVEGRIYSNVCPWPEEADFLAGYRTGEREAEIRRRYENARDDLRRAEALYNAAKTDAERAHWAQEIRRRRADLSRFGGFGPGWLF